MQNGKHKRLIFFSFMCFRDNGVEITEDKSSNIKGNDSKCFEKVF
jgi:hypothetical protein